jgi:hypothetical protein
LAAEVLHGLASLMNRFDISMNVLGDLGAAEKSRKVTGKDFKRYEFEVSFAGTDPEEDDRRMLSALSVKRDEKTMSRETFRHLYLPFTNIPNDEEESRVMAERIMDQMVDTGMFVEIVMQRLQQKQAQAAGTPPTGPAPDEASAAAESIAQNITGVGGGEVEGLADVNLGPQFEGAEQVEGAVA